MKGQEAFKDVLYILSAVSNNEIDTNCETIKTIEKSLKALEIIKEKRVDVFRFKKLDFNIFNQLQKSCKLPELTEEEFNLLREVLENE